MKSTLNLKHAALALATLLSLGVSAAYAAGEAAATTNVGSGSSTQSSGSLSGKDKATAIGAGTGAVAGAVVGGPVGAVVGAGVGAYVGHEGTDGNGHVSTAHSEGEGGTVRKAQAALNVKGYNVTVDGRNGPNTQSAVRSYQEKNGLTASGTLDSATLNALGVKS